MRITAGAVFFIITAAGVFFLWRLPAREVIMTPSGAGEVRDAAVPLPAVPEAPREAAETLPATTTAAKQNGKSEIPQQKPLANPPETVRAIYATSWSAGSSRKLAYLADFIRRNKLNALVVDIKDYSGYVGYTTDVPLVKAYHAEERRIPSVNTLVKTLHDAGIYVIGRIAVFQDQRLIAARSDLAVKSKSSGEIWRDRKGLGWADPASREAWAYHVAIAKDALARGFDEINFDYIRFPSDGDISDISYPVWDELVPQAEVIRDFVSYLRTELSAAKISADIFGLSVVEAGDLGIGQHFEYLLPSFDAVAPMAYPSHYAKGFLGYANPASYPYEVVRYSIEHAVRRADAMQGTSTAPIASVRPWLQAFDLGATYDAEKIREQIRASEEAGGNGYMLWSPSNVYIDYAL